MEQKLIKVCYYTTTERYEHTTFCNKLERSSIDLSYHCYVTHKGKDYPTLTFDDNKLISAKVIYHG
jgi:hypothetical protein